MRCTIINGRVICVVVVALVDDLEIVLRDLIHQILITALQIGVHSLHLYLLSNPLLNDLDGVLVVFDLCLGLHLLLVLQLLMIEGVLTADVGADLLILVR